MTSSTAPPWERVWTVTDFYDGPRRGIADFDGAPHLYVSDHDSLHDDHDDVYRLAPVDAEVFALALEDWRIWLRFEDAYRLGRVTLADHPALPDERTRHHELERRLAGRLEITGDIVRARAEWGEGAWKARDEDARVRWFVVAPSGPSDAD
jgi:hypothetical protein